MDTYQWSTAEKRSLDEIDLGFRRYRIHRKRAEETMAQSLRRYGQLSPSHAGGRFQTAYGRPRSKGN